MGNRLTRSSVLSDPSVIALLNREFVATELNVTDQGFPRFLPGLAWWKTLYHRLSLSQAGFGNQVVVDASGTFPLASGDDGQVDHWATSIDYNPSLYGAMLHTALDRSRRLHDIQVDPALSEGERKRRVDQLESEVGASVAKAYHLAAW